MTTDDIKSVQIMIQSNDGEVYFDGGCYCACGDLRPQTWEDVAEIYNLQKNPDVISEFDEFWHFE